MEELCEVRRQGLTRFVGISSHSPDVLMAALRAGACDVVMFAAGAHSDPRYVEEVLPEAKRRGVGTVCFKAFGAGKLLTDTAGYGRPLAARPRGKLSSGGSPVPAESALPRLAVAECVRFVLTCDPDVALLGLSSPDEQDEAFAAARAFEPMSPEEMVSLRGRAAEAVRGKGGCWWNPGG
jgi:aryl-alcohol dehydrogenase-like predicted oxidoreductase